MRVCACLVYVLDKVRQIARNAVITTYGDDSMQIAADCQVRAPRLSGR